MHDYVLELHEPGAMCVNVPEGSKKVHWGIDRGYLRPKALPPCRSWRMLDDEDGAVGWWFLIVGERCHFGVSLEGWDHGLPQPFPGTPALHHRTKMNAIHE